MQRWIAYAAVLVIIVGAVFFRVRQGAPVKEVNIEKVDLHLLSPSILASGTLAYRSEVKLVPEVLGRVRDIFVEEGDRVKQGELLLRLDQTVALATTAQLEAELNAARLKIQRERAMLEFQDSKFKRYESLRKTGVIDANTYEDVVSQHKVAQVELDTDVEVERQNEAQLKQAREQLAKTEFRSPMDGEVTAIFIKVGETAVPSATSIAGSELMEIANTASRYAEVNVDESDVGRVEVGQTASIVPAAFPDASWSGKVESVAVSPRQNSGQSKTYLVKILLSETDARSFRPGMSCRAEIITRGSGASRALAVPVQAVRYEDTIEKGQDRTKGSVFLARAGRAVRREVDVGTADDNYVEIRSGIKQGERVVTGPAKVLRFLEDGDSLSLVDAE
jgi:HlyD family secretion protein